MDSRVLRHHQLIIQLTPLTRSLPANRLRLHLPVLDPGGTHRHNASKLNLVLEVRNNPNILINGTRNGTLATNLPPKLGLRRPKTRAVVEVAEEDGFVAVAADGLEIDRV